MQKQFVLEFCRRTVVRQGLGLKGHLGKLLEAFVADARNGTGRVYDGRDNFENVRDIESEDDMDLQGRPKPRETAFHDSR